MLASPPYTFSFRLTEPHSPLPRPRRKAQPAAGLGGSGRVRAGQGAHAQQHPKDGRPWAAQRMQGEVGMMVA